LQVEDFDDLNSIKKNKKDDDISEVSAITDNIQRMKQLK
jgi:hypothetical protein